MYELQTVEELKNWTAALSISNKNLVSLVELTLVIANGQKSSSFKRNQNQYCQAKNTGFELCHEFDRTVLFSLANFSI